MRTLRLPLLVMCGASFSLVCARPPAVQSPSSPEDLDGLLGRAAKIAPGTLTFPPATPDRSPRPALPADYGAYGAAAPLAVLEPALDSQRQFSMTGASVRVVFNQAMARGEGKVDKARKAGELFFPAPGALRIAPEIPGVTRWVNERTLEFTASRPFDVDKPYDIEVSSVETASGKKLEAGWKATFTATPSFVVAGKELGYIPRPGEPRVIAVHPSDASHLRRTATFSVLYDQPIELPLARSLIDLEDRGGTAISAMFDHPAGPTFQGVKVDPRYVVLVRSTRPLGFGQDVVLTARDRKDKTGGRSSSFTVAGPLIHTEVSCGWSDDGECVFRDGTLKLSGRSLHVVFNNPLVADERALSTKVTVSPKVRNLSVRSIGWEEGRLLLSGEFESSKTYQVTVAGLADLFGNRQASPVRFKVQMAPQSGSVAMPEGLIVLDEGTSKRFAITTRNVASAELVAWPVPVGDAAAFESALAKARVRELPEEGTPIRIPVTVKAERDRSVETEVDLSTRLTPGTSYVTTVRPVAFSFDAAPMKFPRGSEASRPPVALLSPGSPKTLAVHAELLPNATLVHVARLTSGEPVAGATVRFGSEEATAAVTTDARGVALLRAPSQGGDREGGAPTNAGEGALLQVHAADADLLLPLSGDGISAKQLFPSLTSGAEPGAQDRRAVVLTDRGIYRPGSTVWIKATVRRPEGAKLVSMPGAPLRVRIVGPTGDEVLSERAAANDMGSVATRFAIPKDAKLGRYQLRVEEPDHAEPPLALAMIQVAEFEAPRFAVDIDATAGEIERASKPKTLPVAQLRATVRGRYLFGAPMDGAAVHWTLKRAVAPFPAGPLSEELAFRRKPRWYDEDREDKAWSRAGEARLAADGTLKVEHALELDPTLGPQEFVLEADVSDSSYRHIAGRAAVVKHPAPRYAGLKLGKGWIDVGETFPVELGVLSAEGQAVDGATVTARLSRIEWKSVQRRGAGGALRWDWTSSRSEVGRCSVKSASKPVPCQLTAARAGDYEVTAEVDGRRGGTASFWAWHEGDDGDAATPGPSRGRTLELVADKSRYLPGDQAKILVKSPYPAATALLTIEQGGLVDHREVKVQGSAAVFDVPLTAAHAPYVHATVTLLPIGAKGEALADYRIGAIRLPVALSASRLSVALQSDKATYEPGQEAEISVEVKDNGQPEPHAEIALAVVDEGILRLTNFHAVDPVPALHPGRALAFRIRDSRKGLSELFERSHIAGDGGGAGEATIQSTRKDFVETALWRPNLRTDAAGRATVRLRLPDNLTQFRIMAVALDDEGKGAASESDFTVRKPVMLVPVVPRFALSGDRFEAAAMLHNNTPDPIMAKVTLGERSTEVTLSGNGKSRVAFSLTAGAPGQMTLGFAALGSGDKVLDRVESRVRVEEPGIDEHPHLEGAFARAQEIAIAVPEGVRADAATNISVEVGQHLWPELGQRLDYLLDYPHGCVEQTTSSTLPLLAARAILPRIGFTRLSDAELKVRIKAGLDRLASMRTESGGLAYWPGGGEPNVYGTAYAMRAVVLSREAGIEAPAGLLEGMKRYLGERLLSASIEPEVQAAIAQSLAELGELPQSAADALHERAGRSVFGQASVAIALRALGGQEDRVEKILDQVEASFDAEGHLTAPPGHDDFYYYGSPTRTKAQAAIALARLRPRSTRLPRLLKDLTESTESYTTQATAYSLLGLAEHLKGTAGAGAAFRVTLDGAELAPMRDLGMGSRVFQIPIERLRGKKATLRLSTDSDVALGFMVNARWRRPLSAAGSLTATSTDHGPSVYRVFTDSKGGPVDLAHVHAGDVLRVAVMLRLPVAHVERGRLGYVAVTDRLPAGFEPIQPDLATVANVPELSSQHPFARLLHSYSSPASHVELHDDRVNLYFDRIWGDEVAATYLVRASTPGEFTLPPAAGELMYEGDSLGYSEAGEVTVQ